MGRPLAKNRREFNSRFIYQNRDHEVMSTPDQPVSSANRLESLDVIRGVAVLGILMVNVQYFAMLPTAAQNPTSMLDMTGANLTAWVITHVFFELKFITIFSALFGAGIILMVGEDKDASRKRHYSRMRWLFVFGLIHGFIFWYGDILLPYAVMGFVVVLFRHMSPAKLIIWGLIWISLTGLIFVGSMISLQFVPPEQSGMVLPQDTIDEIVATYQAGFLDRLPINALNEAQFAIVQTLMFSGRLIGVMFIGMALMKTGFLSGSWSMSRYGLIAGVCLVIGLGLSAYGAQLAVAHDFALTHLWQHTLTNYTGSLFTALGYGAAIMLIVKTPTLKWIRFPFAQAGRMAFSNYLMSTLVMTFIFVGSPGLGLFATVERADQSLLVLATWAGLLVFSVVWLRFFQMGPMEWIWRSLSYGQVQSLRKPVTD